MLYGTLIVTVTIPGEEPRMVIVEKFDDEMHARLAAYYYTLIRPVEPTREELLQRTKVNRCDGPVNANIYRNIWK